MKRNHFFVLIFFVTLLSSCTFKYTGLDITTPIAQSITIPTALLAIPENTNIHPELNDITPEKIKHLGFLAELGTGNIIDVEVSPDEETIAVYTTSGIYLYDRTLLNEKGVLEVSSNSENAISFNPTGNELLFSNSTALISWDLLTQESHLQFFSAIPGWRVSNIEYSPSGKQIVVTTMGGYRPCDGEGINFALYNLEGDLLFDRYYCAAYTEYFYYFTEKSEIVFVFTSIMTTVYPLEIHVADLETGMLLASAIKRPVDYEGDYTEDITGSIGFLPTIEEIFTSQNEAQMRTFYPINNGDCEPRPADGNTTDTYKVLFSDSQTALLAVSHFGNLINLELWDATQCKRNKTISYPSSRNISFSPDSQLLASGNGFNVYVWDMNSMSLRFTVYGTSFGNPIDIFSFNADGKRLLTSTRSREYYHTQMPYRDYSIAIWDTQTGERLFDINHEGGFLKRVIATSDPEIMMIWDSKGISLWDISRGYLKSTLPPGVFALDASRNGIWIAEQEQENNSEIILFDLQTGKNVRHLTTITDANISDLRINIDSTLMEVLYRDKSNNQFIEMVDIETSEKLWTISEENNRRFIETGENYYGQYYRGVRLQFFPESEHDIRSQFYPGFSPSSNDWLLITRQDEILYFWDVQNEEYLGEVQLFDDYQAISLSPDKHLLAVVRNDGTILLFGFGEN